MGLVHVFGSYGEGYTNITTEQLNSPSTLLGFFFSPYIFYNFGSYSSTIVPEWQTALLAITSVIVFAIAKCGILSSLIILFNETQYSSFFKKTLFFAIRYFIMMFAIIGFLLVLVLIYRSPIHHSCSSRENCNIGEASTLILIAQSQYRLKVRIGETVYAGIFTLVGDGVFLSSNIMSPVGYKLEYDSRPFVARQVVAGLLGVMIYAGTTWVILWFIEDEHEHVFT